MTAEEAVEKAIRRQYQYGKPANLHTIPEKATKLLLAASAGRHTHETAWKEIAAAIQSLMSKDKIDASLSDPSKDWKVK